MRSHLEHVVVWNGCRDHPAGRLLFTEEPEPVVKATPFAAFVDRGSVTAAVRRLLPIFGSEWFTVRQVRDLTGCSLDQAHNAINNLQRQGDLERERKMAMRGRRLEQRYRFRGQA